MEFRTVFAESKPIIGVVHLQPLPGSPRYAGDLQAVAARAVADAVKLSGGGCDALIVENFHDAPFRKDQVGPETCASMTLVAASVIEAVGVPVGLNVLRNDAMTAVAVAAVTGAGFVRVNVHVGVMVTDQGLIEGRAAETIRFRSQLRSKVAVFADVMVKHGTALGAQDLVQAAHDAYYRGLASALILTGSGTGRPCDLAQVRLVRSSLPEAPVLIGSGVTPDNAAEMMAGSDGLIVGSWFHAEGRLEQPVDPARVKQIAAATRHVRAG